ncbi:MAG: hypothetical protein Q7K55_03225 [Candidatus Levybacteria bacterium]|nr:hypothetical protein [Candidatus Levybacteria bacterium]
MGNLPSPDTREPARPSRRAFIGGAATIATVVVAGKELDVIGKAGEALGKLLDTPHNKFIIYKDGKPVITDTPQPVNVEFIPQSQEATERSIGKNILFRDEPKTINTKEFKIPPGEIKTTQAVEVFGDGYGGGDTKELNVEYKGGTYKGGKWFSPYKDGQFVRPDGKPLEKGEKPYFTSGNFVTVNRQATSNK